MEVRGAHPERKTWSLQVFQYNHGIPPPEVSRHHVEPTMPADPSYVMISHQMKWLDGRGYVEVKPVSWDENSPKFHP